MQLRRWRRWFDSKMTSNRFHSGGKQGCVQLSGCPLFYAVRDKRLSFYLLNNRVIKLAAIGKIMDKILPPRLLVNICFLVVTEGFLQASDRISNLYFFNFLTTLSGTGNFFFKKLLKISDKQFICGFFNFSINCFLEEY